MKKAEAALKQEKIEVEAEKKRAHDRTDVDRKEHSSNLPRNARS